MNNPFVWNTEPFDHEIRRELLLANDSPSELLQPEVTTTGDSILPAATGNKTGGARAVGRKCVNTLFKVGSAALNTMHRTKK